MFGLYTNFTSTPEMHFAVFFIVQLYTQFPGRESGGAGLLYCQSLILYVPVPDGFFFNLSSVISHVRKNRSLLLLVEYCTPITMLYASSYLYAFYPTSRMVWSNTITGGSRNQHRPVTDMQNNKTFITMSTKASACALFITSLILVTSLHHIFYTSLYGSTPMYWHIRVASSLEISKSLYPLIYF
jgi:hypothetical protein